ISKPAPPFTLARLDAPAQTLSPQDLRGQVWLLNVWASWCTACLQEHGLMLELAREGGHVLVGLNYKDQPDDARRWLSRHGDPYRVSLSDLDGRVGIDYGVYGLPETFIVDKQGVIRHKHIGALTRDALRHRILPLMRKLDG
ncbi:MAG: DsbE family thiol:disulfide interchange protein, partial [Rubrivivax sp.]|nr:DsbE family thiol:disulfide interchange protein [Rubrivivax sp.]